MDLPSLKTVEESFKICVLLVNWLTCGSPDLVLSTPRTCFGQSPLWTETRSTRYPKCRETTCLPFCRNRKSARTTSRKRGCSSKRAGSASSRCCYSGRPGVGPGSVCKRGWDPASGKAVLVYYNHYLFGKQGRPRNLEFCWSSWGSWRSGRKTWSSGSSRLWRVD